MKKVKLLYVITSLGLGGAERLLLAYLKGLDPEKFSFHVYTLRDKPDDLKSEISNYAELKSLGMKNKFNPLVIFSLWRIIKFEQPQIIHTHLFQPRVYTTIAHLFAAKRVLITHKHSVVNPGKHHLFMFLEMLCILLNKKVIAISQSVKRTLKKYEFIPERKIFVLTNGIDINEFRSARRDRQFSLEKTIYLGFVGRIEKSKGIKYLLFAMKRILAKYPNTQLEIVGDGSHLNDLKALSKKLNISNSVKFFGKLVNPIPNYNRMSIFIMPSVLEGFGIVLLEAMAAGVPVIATKVDGIKEVVVDGESGILIPPKNPNAIAEAVFKIIEQPELTMKLIEQGINRAKLFDVRSHIQKLENFYYSLLGAESYQ